MTSDGIKDLWGAVATEEPGIVNVKFPVLPFFPWQEEATKAFLRNPVLREMTKDPQFKGDGKRFFALLINRRGGKDVLAYQWAVLMCMLVPGFNVIYIHKTQKLCRRAIMKGTWPLKDLPPGSPLSFMQLIPKEAKAKLNSTEGVITFPNLATITFMGADMLEARGLEANMVVATEFDYWDRQDYANEQVMSALARTKGLWVGASTLQKKGRWYDICFDSAKKKDDRYYRIIRDADTCLDTNGKRVADEEYIADLLASGQMSQEQIDREFYHNIQQGVYGAVFPAEVTAAKRAGRVHKYIDIDPTKPVTTSWDMGSKNPTVVIFWQTDGLSHYMVDMLVHTRKTPEWVAARVLEWAEDNGDGPDNPLVFDRHYLPWEAGRRDQSGGDDDGETVSKEWLVRKAGLRNTFCAPKPREKTDATERVRQAFHTLHFNEDKCWDVWRAVGEYPYEINSKDEILDRPDQKHWSADYVDSIQSYVTGRQLVLARRAAVADRKAAGDKMLSLATRRRLRSRSRRAGGSGGSWMRR